MREQLNDRSRLELMMEAIVNVETFLHGKNETDFLEDKLLAHAVMFNIQHLGENAYKLSRQFVDDNTDVDWKAIEGLRHFLVHDYYNVSLPRVWLIVQNDLPPLKR